MIEDALRTKLLLNTTLTGLVADRIYVNEAPQGGAKPYVVYTVITIEPIYTAHCIQDEVTIQYSVFAERYASARTIVNVIRTDLERFSGVLSGISVLNIDFAGVGASEKEKDSRLAHISYDFKTTINK
jgi:hypothetical protein